jgi:hypothetical protein
MRGFHKYRIGAVALAAASALFSITTPASASVEISTNPTANMTCSGGVCSPTAASAVLNATDLATMLASGDVKVTTGSGATNIVVKSPVGWASTNRLTLDANQSVEIEKPVMVTGTGGVTVTTNDGGSGGDLMFDGKGNVTFWDLSSSLIVNGNSYTLVGDIASLASDIAANPTGFYALANDYDASVDGTYTSIPIGTEFFGVFEGAGHVISNFAIHSPDFSVGLFQEVQGTLRDVGLAKASISTNGSKAIAGTLLAVSDQATIVGCYASGAVVSGDSGAAGGLVGGSRSISDGAIMRSHASVNVSGADGSVVGGLVGSSGFSISLSYATGKVTGGGNSAVGGLLGYGENRATQSYATGKVIGGANSTVGGLVAVAESTGITNSYATGAVKAGDGSKVGGFIGEIEAMIRTSYSTGHVGAKAAAASGGLIGQVDQGSTLDHDYWDTNTTGKNGHQGCDGRRCGGQSNGRTTTQLQSGLPAGFDPNVWGEKQNINGGLPYLLALPPK